MFVGQDIEAEGNRPAESKLPSVENLRLKDPFTMADLGLLIGFIGFYLEWIPNFEIRIARWREYQRMCPPNKTTRDIERQFLHQFWNSEDVGLKNQLLDEIKERPTLKRPDWNRRFYLKTDWSKNGKSAVLLQLDPESEEAARAEAAEIAGAPCVFDTPGCTKEFRLLPIAFISMRNSKQEESWHSYTGEAATGLWAMKKFKRYLFGRPFTWLTDCSGLKQFFEGEETPTHMNQRMRVNLLFYDFTIGHRPNSMMKEVDCLNRCNYQTAEWRKIGQGLDVQPKPIASLIMRTGGCSFSNVSVQEKGPSGAARALLAKQFQPRTVYVLSAATNTTVHACELAGIQVDIAAKVEDRRLLDFHPILGEQSSQMGYIQTEALMEKLLTQGKNQKVDWIVAIDGGEQDAVWLDGGLDKFKELVKLAAKPDHGLQALVTFGSHRTKTSDHDWIEKELRWQCLTVLMEATRHGSAIESRHCVTVATADPETLETLVYETSPPGHIGEHLDALATTDPEDDAVALADLHRVWRPDPDAIKEDLSKARTAMEVQRVSGDESGHRITVFDTRFPAPPLTERSHRWYNSPFAIEVLDGAKGSAVRGIRIQELLRIFGFDDERSDRLIWCNQGELVDLLVATPPADLVATALHGLWQAEQKTLVQPSDTKKVTFTDPQVQEEAELVKTLRSMPMRELNRVTTLPMPTLEDWKQALRRDQDTHRVITAMQSCTDLQIKELNSKKHHEEWRRNRLEVEDGVLYRCEASKRASLRQLRTKVAPKGLRQTMFAALHPSPMAGHSSYDKTYWRIAARFWWPTMASDINRLCSGCAMCKATNLTSHDAQQIMRTIFSDVPFDVVVMDAWKPGKFAGKKKRKTAVLTCLDVMTAFAGADFLETELASEAAMSAFQTFFVTRGLPKLVTHDAGGTFAGFVLQLCEILGVATYAVTRENHRATLCERFHRFLNKIEKIHAAEHQTFEEWLMGVWFAIHAWNSAPVDGTDVIRSVAAIGRDFPFPIDVSGEPTVPRDHFNTGETVLEHLSIAFPLLYKQRELLRMLQEERREYHREMKNQSRNMKTFTPGELVIVRKQVKTTRGGNEPAKLMIRARGPYRALEEVHPGTYKIQKLPFEEGRGRRGKAYKESAARMEKLPSTLALHKNADGLDTKLATFSSAAVPCPLEKTLGIINFGTHNMAPQDRHFAHDRIADLWPEAQLEADEDDDEEEEDELMEQEDRAEAESQVEAQPPEEASIEPPATETVVEPMEPVARAATAPKPAPKRTKGTEATPQPERQSKRQRKLPKRCQEEEEEGPQLGLSEQDKTKKMFADINKSKDKLFFIRHRVHSTGKHKWYLVQVRLEDTDPTRAKSDGIYQVRFQIRHQQDSNYRLQRQCRHWPETHRLRQDNSFAAIQLVRPDKVEAYLRRNQHSHAAYDLEVNLAKDGIIGPFDFMPAGATTNQETTIVPSYCWDGLLAAQRTYGIDASDINEVVPLR